MNYKDPYAGILLKLERIKQNKGQKEICHGICVPSYLSKIERNIVNVDKDILEQLFKTLGIEYTSEKDFILCTKKLIAKYLNNKLYNINDDTYLKLQELEKSLNYSPLAIDWLLIQGFEKQKNILPLLSELEDAMTNNQKALYYLLHRLTKNNSKQILPLHIESHKILNNSYSLLNLMSSYFTLANYEKVNEYAVQCISLALEEGNTFNLAECYRLQGDVYACLNIDSMMIKYYKKCMNLLQNTLWKKHLNNIYYNIGATYLHSQKYELAMEYPEKISNAEYDFLLNHKKALVKIRSGQHDEAKNFLEIMKNAILNANFNAYIENLMYKEAIMEMDRDFLNNPKFIDLLEELAFYLQEKRHLGFYLFYHDLLKEAYCKQRKYKKALELDSKLSSKIKINPIKQ